MVDLLRLPLSSNLSLEDNQNELYSVGQRTKDVGVVVLTDRSGPHTKTVLAREEVANDGVKVINTIGN